MTSQLPEELLVSILAFELRLADRFFQDERLESYASSAKSTSSNLLLVCKRWLRLGRPILYEGILLRSSRQSRSLASTFRENPDFGTLVRRLRLEAGFVIELKVVLATTSKIRTLFLNTNLPYTEKVTGLCSSLVNVDPQRLILKDQNLPSKSLTKNRSTVVEQLRRCIQCWSSMVCPINHKYSALLTNYLLTVGIQL